MSATRYVAELAQRLDIPKDTLQKALLTAIRATVIKVAKDQTLFDTLDKKNMYAVENIALQMVEGILHKTLNDNSERDFALWVIHKELANHSLYTPTAAKQLLKQEVYQDLVKAHPSPRWKEMADLLWKHKYFENIDVNDVLFERMYAQPWSSQGLNCNGLSIGWNNSLMYGQARMGIDSIWNKVSDALILIWWPDADKVGKRTWQHVITMLNEVLDPKSKRHLDLVKDRNDIRDELKLELRA